ncbi:MAG TPA: LemA family protein [Gallionella sp.]|nr:LemA family protein [Gallionella sp.]
MRILWMVLLATLLSGCGYGTLQATDKQIKASWTEVLNQYQRRADLIPKLVNIVNGYAAQEKSALQDVTEARAKIDGIQATPELFNDPVAFAKFQAAQNQLTSALIRLLVVTENYPKLRSDQNFRDLQAQLMDIENRFTVARDSYIQAAQKFNVEIRTYPSSMTAMLLFYKAKPPFTVENDKGISPTPTVNLPSPKVPISVD